MTKRLVEGHMIRMARIDPPPSMEGLELVGNIEVVVGPVFYVTPLGSELLTSCFRADENREHAVSIVNGSLWEILETLPFHQGAN